MSKIKGVSLLLSVFLFFSLFTASSPSASHKKAVNLLLITIDTLRADRLSCYSPEHLQTPNMDSLAERGIIFTRAFAHTSTTLPSHANILLGTVPLYHGVHDNGIFVVQENFLTLAEHLKNHGYSTGAFVGAYPLDSRFGLARGFDVYDDQYRDQNSQKLSAIERKAERVLDSALEWLKAQQRPWFLWVHCFDPHDPYEPPEPFRTQYEKQLYDGEVAYVDASLGKLFHYMNSHDLYASTLVILTGDHGESLGQHGEKTHGYFAYNSTLWIPLVISLPDAKKGQVDQVVCHVDIFPTVCDVLRIKKPAFLQGLSLLPSIRGKKLPVRPVYFESMYPYYSRGWAPIQGFIHGDEKFIESPLPELYDLGKDFLELRNLAEEKDLERYRKQLEQIMRNHSLPQEQKTKSQKVDREALEKLRSLGYISSQRSVPKKEFGPQDDVKNLLPFHNKSTEAMELYRQGRAQESIRLLKEILTERQDIDIAYSNLATIYKAQGRLGEALEVLRQGLEFLPSSYEVFSTYVNYLLNAGRHDEVIALFNKWNLRQMEHDPEIWNFLGAAYSGKEEFQKAIEAYEMALSLDDRYPVIFNNLATVYISIFLKTKDPNAYQKSLQNFERAIELNPNYASAYNGLGSAHLLTGNTDRAINCLEKALEINPDFGLALYNLGLAYLEKGEKARALDCFLKYRQKHVRSLSPSEIKKLEELIQKCR